MVDDEDTGEEPEGVRGYGHREPSAELEQLSSNLASFYVATYRIHASLEREDVLTAIEEVIVNLIGAEELAIFERDGSAGRLSLVRAMGIDLERTLHSTIIESVVKSGNIYVRTTLHDGAEVDGPSICIPLKVGETVTGVVAIYSFLSHKRRLESVDYELCNILATHAGSALYSSRLHARAKGQELAW
jgi:hypothetical protein